MDSEILAYLAGCIDCDGCIGIRRSTYAMRRRIDTFQPVYSERVMLKQVTAEVPSLLHDYFGGYLGVTKPSATYGRPLHSWEVSDRRAADLLVAVLPYLRVKRAQAENCLVLRELKHASKEARMAPGRGHVGGASRPESIGNLMEAAYQRAKDLNRVGTR